MIDEEVSRRALLKTGVGGLAAGAVLTSALQRALATPATRRSGTLMDVEHVVIFMQENRSFDHYFGSLAGVRGFADPVPVKLPHGGPVWRQRDRHGAETTPFHFDTRNTNFPVMKSLDHHWASGHVAWNEGRYDRWIDAKGPLTMGYLTREDIPYHYALADAFTICDSYFSSLQGPTCPNRFYLMTGSVDHHGRGGGPVIDDIDITQKPNGVVFGKGWVTYAEQLQSAGIDWRVYRQGVDLASDDDSDGGMNSLLAFERFRQAKPGDALYERGVRPRRLEQLKEDVLKGALPQVSWIVPPRLFCEHPKWPPSYGVEYIARILDALTADPVVWSKTVLLLMYDENDGFFDHVVPPVPPLSPGDGLSTVATDDERHPVTGQPYGLGMRVPMLVISPWSKGGWVCSEVFDHTSVIRFLERRFGVRNDNISAWRRTVCGDLVSAFDFAKPDSRPPRSLATIGASEKLPDEAIFRQFKATFAAKPKPVAPAIASPPVVEAGLRWSRPLGYALAVEAERADDHLKVTFSNHGALGAFFYARDLNDLEKAPRRYTVGAGASISELIFVGDSPHDIVIEGPAGFRRGFAGDRTGRLGVKSRPTAEGDVVITLVNGHGTSQNVDIKNGYDGHSVRVRLNPGAVIDRLLRLKRSSGWYDLTISCEGLRHYYRGHAESGLSGTSDPHMMQV